MVGKEERVEKEEDAKDFPLGDELENRIEFYEWINAKEFQIEDSKNITNYPKFVIDESNHVKNLSRFKVVTNLGAS